jgi:hypothetical protein
MKLVRWSLVLAEAADVDLAAAVVVAVETVAASAADVVEIAVDVMAAAETVGNFKIQFLRRRRSKERLFFVLILG